MGGLHEGGARESGMMPAVAALRTFETPAKDQNVLLRLRNADHGKVFGPARPLQRGLAGLLGAVQARND